MDIGVLSVTILLTVLVGMELEARDFRQVARRKGVLLGTLLLLPAILLPALGFTLARALALLPHECLVPGAVSGRVLLAVRFPFLTDTLPALR